MSVNAADKKVMELVEIVKKRKEEINKAEKPQWNTNMSFGYTEDTSSRTNLQTVIDLKQLISIVAFLNEKEKSFNEAATELGVEAKFKWLDFSVAEWKADIALRISKIQISKKKKELEVFESKLNGLISPELKRKLDLEALEEELLNGNV